MSIDLSSLERGCWRFKRFRPSLFKNHH